MKHNTKYSNYLSAGYMYQMSIIIMSQQCHFQTLVCYMHYIKRDIIVFKVNLHSFKKEKSLKNAKTTQNMVIFSLLMYKRNTNTFSFSTTIPFYVFFFTLPNTPLCTTFCLEKCSKCVLFEQTI